MNPRTRRAALYAIGTIAILASANALAHSYAGLYDWAVHHRLSGWQAKSWPAEIDVFLAIGELALYVAYLDDWPTRQRIWPWTTAVVGLAVSIAGNVGHIQTQPGHPVILADRLTAATSPLAAFAGLAIGLLVLKMARQQAMPKAQTTITPTELTLAPRPLIHQPTSGEPDQAATLSPMHAYEVSQPKDSLLADARQILEDARARGVHISQRHLAEQLRKRGHRFPNARLGSIAGTIGLTPEHRAA